MSISSVILILLRSFASFGITIQVDYQWLNVDMAADVAMLVAVVVVGAKEISQPKRLHDSVICATSRTMI